MLGRVIEAATERAYYDLLRERILEPHGLDEIGLQDRSALPGITPGYTMGARNLRDDGTMKFDPSSEWTGRRTHHESHDAGPSSTGRSRRGGSCSRSPLTKCSPSPAGGIRTTPDWHYGFGLFVYDAEASFGHGGMWPGYRTHVRHYAESGITVAVQTNRDGRLDMQAVVDRIVSSLGEGEPPSPPGEMMRNLRLPVRLIPQTPLSGDRP